MICLGRGRFFMAISVAKLIVGFSVEVTGRLMVMILRGCGRDKFDGGGSSGGCNHAQRSD